jgi:hypothetical protein
MYDYGIGVRPKQSLVVRGVDEACFEGEARLVPGSKLSTRSLRFRTPWGTVSQTVVVTFTNNTQMTQRLVGTASITQAPEQRPSAGHAVARLRQRR